MLAVPVLVYAAGQGARAATATSLVVVGAAAVVGMVAHWRAGRVRVGLGILFGLAGVGGSLVGSAANRQLPANWLLLAFSVLVVVAAWRMLIGCPTCTRVGERRELLAAYNRDIGSPDGTLLLALRHRVDTKAILGVLGAGTAIGFLTGLFGVGGGFVIIPALTLLLGLSMPDAIGTSLLVIAINSASALAARLATTSIDWTVTLPFALAAIAGVIAGRRLGSRLDPERSLRWFAALLVTVGVYTAIRAGVALAG